MVLAIRNGHYEVAALLVEKGANVNAGDRVNRTPLYMAVDMHSLDWIQNRPAPKAEGALDSLDLVRLLLEKGAKPDAQLSGNAPGWKGDAIAAQNTFGNVIGAGTTPFVRAAKNGDLAVMRLLIDKGADPNIATRNKTTALMALVGGLGRKYGADLQVSAAEEKNALEAAKLLLDLGADVNAANEAGQTLAARGRRDRRQRRGALPGGARRPARRQDAAGPHGAGRVAARRAECRRRARRGARGHRGAAARADDAARHRREAARLRRRRGRRPRNRRKRVPEPAVRSAARAVFSRRPRCAWPCARWLAAAASADRPTSDARRRRRIPWSRASAARRTTTPSARPATSAI